LRLKEGLRALTASIPLVALAVIPFALTFGSTVVASHCESSY
jgi:predicted branched-subunit amino acid permease